MLRQKRTKSKGGLKEMKIFAFFLPQFHTIPENDQWWGEGFTEWTNVKGATPLFKGHKQPIHPLDNRYYNLLQKETVEWQTSLLNRYRVDGLIYYHYYFNGKLLLEKPAENLLKWKDIDQRFFFCWANHPWYKSWKGSKELLMPLEYGDENSWESHFQYLLPFFRDHRYEKDDNKPLFMVFKSDFQQKHDLFNYFNRRCMEEGFNGICLIESYSGNQAISSFNDNICSCTQMVFYREPLIQKIFFDYYNGLSMKIKKRIMKELRNIGLIKRPHIYPGEQLMSNKLRIESFGDNVAHGLWFEWDNTPRHKERGYIITPYQKNQFDQYMELIKNERYLFINAWNEWCEGMILEPTEENGYKYLEWIKEWRERNSNRE